MQHIKSTRADYAATSLHAVPQHVSKVMLLFKSLSTRLFAYPTRLKTSCVGLLLFSLLSLSGMAQQVVLKGHIKSKSNQPLPGVSIAVKGSYDGTITDSTGYYRFTVEKADTIKLVFSFIGYKSIEKRLVPPYAKEKIIDVQLEEIANELNTVTITAGMFEASAEKKNVMLKPLDIATTAAGGADITAVIQMLPGAQKTGESEGLYVRGGSALETKMLIDGMYVQNPFYSPNPGIAQRGRFSPFMFKNTSFSTGGFSVQYGQALSSILALQTNDKMNESGWNASLNLMSVGLTGAKATDTYSLSVNGYYGNTDFLNRLSRQNVDWIRAPQYKGGSVTWVWKPSEYTTVKAYATGSYNDLSIYLNDYFRPEPGHRFQYQVTNDNYYVNTSIHSAFGRDYSWTLDGGLSYNRNNDRYALDDSQFSKDEEQLQARYVLKKKFSDAVNVTLGNDWNRIYQKDYFPNVYAYQLYENNASFFVEPEWFITNRLGIKAGGRVDYSSTLQKAVLSPRSTIAYKLGAASQISVAAGLFTQTPYYKYLYVGKDLDFEKAFHYIASYQLIKEKRTFKAEAFYKKYQDLVWEQTNQPFDADPLRFPTGRLSNQGYGYAQGFDLFWRDRKTFKNADYWITYTYIDSRRLFQNYPVEAVPTFLSRNNINVIYKYSFPAINCNLGFTYTYADGRPYYNPGNTRFLADYTQPYHNFALSASYLTNIAKNFTILYATVDNLFNRQNIYTYRYYQNQIARDPILPQTQRSFFVGVLIYFSSKFKVPDEFKVLK